MKKIDAGGGLIHGNAADFAHDSSVRLLLSHGASPSLRIAGRATQTASFGDVDVLIPGTVQVAAKAARAASLSGDGAAMEALERCPLFASIHAATVRQAIAAAMEKRVLTRGSTALQTGAPELILLASGEVDIVMGAHLIETIGPGGFWGEERVAGEAPSLCAARAAVDSTCFAIPAATLSDIPIVQWNLLEAFERRLRSFRAGFRFEWSESFRVGVKELDEQHRKLFALVNGLSEAIGRSGVIKGHDAEKQELVSFTGMHFSTEESYMESNGYPRLSIQRREHAALMERLNAFVRAGERRMRPRSETIVDYLKDWLIKHTLIEDLQYKGFFALKGIR